MVQCIYINICLPWRYLEVPFSHESGFHGFLTNHLKTFNGIKQALAMLQTPHCCSMYLKFRSDHLTGTTPRGCEVDHHQLITGTLQDLLQLSLDNTNVSNCLFEGHRWYKKCRNATKTRFSTILPSIYVTGIRN